MQLKTILLAGLLAASASATAQETSSEENTGIRQNIIKVNVTSLPLKNYHLQYERVLSKGVSIAIGGRLMPTGGIPFKSTIIKAVGDDDENVTDVINSSQIGNFAITPEVRFYVGKGYGKGFYIAPYYRYVKFTTNSIQVDYSESTGPERSISLGGDLSAHTGGIMFGAQWFLGKSVSLDWWIVGAHYGSGKGSFTGVPNTPFTPSEQADIRQTLEDIDIPLTDKTVNVSANNVSVNLDGPFGGLRGGIMIGFRF